MGIMVMPVTYLELKKQKIKISYIPLLHPYTVTSIHIHYITSIHSYIQNVIQLAISWTKIRSSLSILGYAFVMTATLPGTKSKMISREEQASNTIQHVQKQLIGLFQHVPLTVTLLAGFQKIAHDISAYIVTTGY